MDYKTSLLAVALFLSLVANSRAAGGLSVDARFDLTNDGIVDASDWQRMTEDADRKSTRLNSSHITNSYAVFCLKKKNKALTGLTDRKTLYETP